MLDQNILFKSCLNDDLAIQKKLKIGQYSHFMRGLYSLLLWYGMQL